MININLKDKHIEKYIKDKCIRFHCLKLNEEKVINYCNNNELKYIINKDTEDEFEIYFEPIYIDGELVGDGYTMMIDKKAFANDALDYYENLNKMNEYIFSGKVRSDYFEREDLRKQKEVQENKEFLRYAEEHKEKILSKYK